MEEDLLKYILVVDDEEQYRVLTEQSLSRWGYGCEVAPDASRAMQKLRAGHFDLVISDIKMPGRSGIELMREAREAFPHLDFIIMTGFPDEYSYSDIIAAGATDFITKPFEVSKLKSKLERIEREKRTLCRLHESNKELSWEAGVNGSIAALSEALIGSHSIEEISRIVLDHARKLTNSPNGYVGYIDQDTGYLTISAMAGWSTGRARGKKTLLKKPTGLWGWVLQHGKPLLTNNPEGDSRSSGVPSGHLAIHRFLSAPARVGEMILGQITLANSDRDYTEKDQMLIERLATIYALAVQRKWVQDELQQARDHLENVFENAAEAIGIVDQHGRFLKWNKTSEQLYGYSFEELRGKRFTEVYADKEALEKMLAQLRRDGFVYGYEIDSKTKDGQVKPFRVSIRLLKNREDKIVGSVAVATDMTDIKNAFTRLETMNEQLQEQIAERERIAEDLRKARDELEKLVVERTERLSKAGDLIKRSIDRFKEITEE